MTLEKRRVKAAIASRGTSSDVIYDVVLRLMRQNGLGGDLLEYGAGTGLFIKRLLVLGYTGAITGVDILSRPAELPERVTWIKGDLNFPVEAPSSSADLVVSTEVIEHLENPRATFREFWRLLRPGGALVLTTPNQESIRSALSLLMRGHFIAFLDSCYPAHITALLGKDLIRICEETGFEAPTLFYSDSGGIPKLPGVLWQDVTFGLLRGRLFSDNQGLIARKPATAER
jgi:2-polyprenyl-3-methyl-5-hydroxy-6-metoxy-1,4-benzoquinol methylase